MPLDRKYVILKMLFSANLLASTVDNRWSRFIMSYSFLRHSGTARVNKQSNVFTATYTFDPQIQWAMTASTRTLQYYTLPDTAIGSRLSWPEWLVTLHSEVVFLPKDSQPSSVG